MVRALSKSRESRFRAFGWEKGEHSNMPDPDELRELGQRLDEVRRQKEPRPSEAPPTSLGIATRFATEMVVAIAVGGGLGWLLGHYLGHKAIFLVVMLVLGAAAGIRNVMRAAAELNAKAAKAANDDKET
jgi:ATP synthase protein I